MPPVPEPSPLRLKLAPFPERIAQYPKAPPNAWTNESERRPPAWNAGGQALVPECLLPTPLREITTVSVAPDGTVAIGGPDGLAALEHGRWRCYAGERWLPSNDVRRVLCREAGAMLVETSAGVSLILPLTRTLADKSAQYEAQIEGRHNRGGYVTVCFLDDPHDLTAGHQHEVSDNDGLWTAMYLAAEAFRSATTGEVEARERAARSMRALLELERVTGIPGFPARALAQKGEPQAVLSTGEWQDAADGQWVWKGDASSDLLPYWTARCHGLFEEGRAPAPRSSRRRR